MKKAIIYFLAALGVIFLCQIVFVVYLFVADPFHLKPTFFPSTVKIVEQLNVEYQDSKESDIIEQELPVDDTNTEAILIPDRVPFTISEAQRQALINLGVSPSSIPASFSTAQEQCFVTVLGEARVIEIKEGAVPSPLEFLRAKSCL